MDWEDIYLMGRAEYLSEELGISISEATKIALKELKDKEKR